MSENLAGNLLSSGGAATWRWHYEHNGGGAAGRAAANRALKERFPTSAQNSRDAVARIAYDGIKAARRLNQANASYNLPASAQGDASSAQRRAGVEGTTQSRFTAHVVLKVTTPNGGISMHNVNVEVNCSNCLNKGVLEQLIADRVAASADYWLRTSFRKSGQSSVEIDSIKFTSATRVVNP